MISLEAEDEKSSSFIYNAVFLCFMTSSIISDSDVAFDVASGGKWNL